MASRRRERQRRDRRRAIAAARVQETKQRAGLAPARQAAPVPAPVVVKRVERAAPVVRQVRPKKPLPVVRDVREPAKPVRSVLRAARSIPAPASVTITPPDRRRVEAKVLRKAAAAPVLAGRKSPAPKLAAQKLAEVALKTPERPSPVGRVSLHGTAFHSATPRRKEPAKKDRVDVPTCKPRPASNRPRRGGGGARRFIPWCG